MCQKNGPPTSNYDEIILDFRYVRDIIYQFPVTQGDEEEIPR